MATPQQPAKEADDPKSVLNGFTSGLVVDDDAGALQEVDEVPSQGASQAPAAVRDAEVVQEHGRTWHKYKKGKYFMPNDLPEQERLDLQHAISVKLLGGLTAAPVKQGAKVLDIGTGTGIWAVQFAKEHPDADVIGIDLSPVQRDDIPPNCHFAVLDAEDPWPFAHKFDHIHARYMSGSFGSFPRVFRACLAALAPGGRAEFQDYYVRLRSDDGTLAGTRLARWNDLLLEGVALFGKDGLVAARFRRMMEEAGFRDVEERALAVPGNPWARGAREKELGAMQMTNILNGIHGMTIGLFTRVLGWEAAEVERLLEGVRRDLRDPSIHFYYVVISVVGRAPE